MPAPSCIACDPDQNWMAWSTSLTPDSRSFVDVLSFPDRQVWKEVALLEKLPAGVLGVRLVADDGLEQWVISNAENKPFELSGQSVTGRMALLEKEPNGQLKLVEQVK